MCLLVSYEAQEWGEVGLREFVEGGHEMWAQSCGDVPMEGLEQRPPGVLGLVSASVHFGGHPGLLLGHRAAVFCHRASVVVHKIGERRGFQVWLL